MSDLSTCQRCSGFVPSSSTACPHCRSASAWWKKPLAIVGAGFASVTLSACYGAPCATSVPLPDGGTSFMCINDLDCAALLPDGGVTRNDPQFVSVCPGGDAGVDGGKTDAGNTDAGHLDGGVDAGP